MSETRSHLHRNEETPESFNNKLTTSLSDSQIEAAEAAVDDPTVPAMSRAGAVRYAVQKTFVEDER